MAAAEYHNPGRGTLICYDRAGREVYIEGRQKVVADLDTEHPPIKAWLTEGLLARTGDASALEQREAAEAQAAAIEAERQAALRRAAEAQAGTIEIIAGEPRPLS